MVQKTVNTLQGFGLVGAFYDASPRRVAPFILEANSSALPTIGYAFTYNSTDPSKAVVGGTGAFAGILVSPHEYALSGLNASLELESGKIGQLCTFGHINVLVDAEANVGYQACYNTTTGAISAVAAGESAPDGYALIANSKFIVTNNAANSVAVLELGN